MDATGFGKLIERSALATAREASTSGGSGGAGSPPLLFVPWAEWDGDGEDGGRFLELCILAGCDYLSHLPGMAMKTAFKQLRKYKTAERVVQVRQMEGNAPPPAGGYERYLRSCVARSRPSGTSVSTTWLYERWYRSIPSRRARRLCLTVARILTTRLPTGSALLVTCTRTRESR